VTKGYVDSIVSANSSGWASKVDIQTILLANGTAVVYSDYWRWGKTVSKSSWVDFTDLIEVKISSQCATSPANPSCTSGYTLYMNVWADASNACNWSSDNLRYRWVICYKTNP
jgi:hypothetical protein